MTANRHRRGIALIWIVLVMFMLIGMVGLAIDLAYLVLVRQQLQNTADASALAGAWKMHTQQYSGINDADVVAAAQYAAAANHVAGQPLVVAGGEVILGRFYRANVTTVVPGFYPGGVANGGPPYNAVKVIANRTTGSGSGPINLLFGPMMGVSTGDLTVLATAIASTYTLGVIITDPTSPNSLNFTGTGSTPKIVINDIVTGTYAGILVDSTNAGSVGWTGNPTLVAADFYLANNQTSAAALLNDATTQKIHYRVPPVLDPLAVIFASNPVPYAVTSTYDSTTKTWSVGYVPGASVISGDKFAPGVHYIGGDLTVGIDATAGCLIYVAPPPGSAPGTKANVNPKNGNETIRVAPITDATSPYYHFGLVVANGDLSIKGNQRVYNSGYFYVPNGTATLQGDPAGTPIGSLVVVKDLTITGNGELVVNYDESLPPIPGPIFLVQ